MHVQSIHMQKLRAFADARIDFIAAATASTGAADNITVLLGDNGAGKSTVLRAVAASVLAPVLEGRPMSGGWIRRPARTVAENSVEAISEAAGIDTVVGLHAQDLVDSGKHAVPARAMMSARIAWQGNSELLQWCPPPDGRVADELRQTQWERHASAFFLVAYGASRWVDDAHLMDAGRPLPPSLQRQQGVASLFDNRGLVPLAAWLPTYAVHNRGRYRQVINLMNRLLPEDCRMLDVTGDQPEGAAIQYQMDGVRLPFRALSDGYQAYAGWIGDMLYHLCLGAPSGRKLVENHGVVLVDEIDLHLHPHWQRDLLPTLARVLPNIQFIVTTHSPLVVGALQPTNIVVLEGAGELGNRCARLPEQVHGRSAEQLLLSPYFGLSSTRSADVAARLQQLRVASESGDPAAAAAYLRLLSSAAC